MKTNFTLPLLAVFGLSGCVQTAYSESIAVTKDADVWVIQTVETETVTQPGEGYPIQLGKIKDVQR